MQSTVKLNIEVTLEPGTCVFRYNEKINEIEKLIVIESHIVKCPCSDEYGILLNDNMPRSYKEIVLVAREELNNNEMVRKSFFLNLNDVWLTPEEAMNAYSELKLQKYKK